MLTIKNIRENRDLIIDRMIKRNLDIAPVLDQVIEKDDQKKSIQNRLQAIQSEMNTISKEIGAYFKNKEIEKANQAKEKTAVLKEEIKNLTADLDVVENELLELFYTIPNVPHESVPKGKTDADNLEIRSGGSMPTLGENNAPHWDLAKKYDIIDFELGNKLTGAGFPVYKGKGARLQRALIAFFLDQALEEGFTEIMPPLLINQDSGYGTGQLPDKEGQMYHVGIDNLFLIPTAEIPVTNIYRDVILAANDFPIKQSAYTPCFRREAGSYGKDVRGLNRLHQFDKVEIVQLQHPDKSYETLDQMVAYVETLVNKLELPYRIVKLCGGDLGFTSALTFDFEVYSAAQEKWLEVSSVSNFEAFQANRLKLRFKEKGEKKTQLAHTLNGSALALPRILAAILENNQTAEGIKIPEVLVQYTGFDMI